LYFRSKVVYTDHINVLSGGGIQRYTFSPYWC
jgi:hypothetical protein